MSVQSSGVWMGRAWGQRGGGQGGGRQGGSWLGPRAGLPSQVVASQGVGIAAGEVVLRQAGVAFGLAAGLFFGDVVLGLARQAGDGIGGVGLLAAQRHGVLAMAPRAFVDPPPGRTRGDEPQLL